MSGGNADWSGCVSGSVAKVHNSLAVLSEGCAPAMVWWPCDSKAIDDEPCVSILTEELPW